MEPLVGWMDKSGDGKLIEESMEKMHVMLNTLKTGSLSFAKLVFRKCSVLTCVGVRFNGSVSAAKYEKLFPVFGLYIAHINL